MAERDEGDGEAVGLKDTRIKTGDHSDMKNFNVYEKLASTWMLCFVVTSARNIQYMF